MKLNMRPGAATLNSTDLVYGDAESCSQVALQHVAAQATNFAHIVGSYLCRVVLFTQPSPLQAGRESVQQIARMGRVLQIRQRWIATVAVQVINLVTRWADTQKRCSYQSMHHVGFAFAAPVQLNGWIPCNQPRSHDTDLRRVAIRGGNALYTPEIANFVYSVVANDWAPRFSHVISSYLVHYTPYTSGVQCARRAKPSSMGI
jgi:hypothetical protein